MLSHNGVQKLLFFKSIIEQHNDLKNMSAPRMSLRQQITS